MAKIADFFVELGLKKDKYDKGMEDANKAPQKLNSFFGGLGTGIVTAFAGVATISALTSFTKQVVGIASQAEAVRKAFQRIDGDKYLQGLRDATRGTVTDLELMKRAVMAENFQIPLEQLGSLFEFARRRAEETGQSVDYLVNSIVTGIGRKSPLILDNLGISAVALKDKMNGVTMETASIGDVATAVGAIAREQLASMGGESVTAAQKLSGVATKWENIKLRIGEAIIESGAFNLSIDTLNGIMDNFEAKSILEASRVISFGMDQFVKDFQSGKVTVEEAETRIEEYSQTMNKLAPLFDTYWDRIFNTTRANEAQKKYEEISKSWVELQHALVSRQITVPTFDYDKIAADAEAAAKEAARAAAEAAKIAAEAEKKKYEAWLKTNEAIRQQNDLAMINGEVMRKSLQGAIADMDALIKAANDKAEAWKTAMNQVFTPDEEGNIDDGTDAITSKFLAIQERTQSFVDDMNQMTSDFIADFISGMAEGIGLLLTGDIGFDTFFNMVLGSFGSFLKQMGAAVIAYGITMSAFKKAFTNPIAAIAAGAALVIAGSVISNLASKGPSVGSAGGTAGMAGGGGGGYQNQVTGYGNQGGFGYTLDTKISGDDLLVIMQRAERNNKRRV